MQSVFKVDLPKDLERSEGRPFIPRRVHRKSRDGCLACKKKHLKCDEVRPSCGKCKKADTPCVYNTPGPCVRRPRTLFLDERDESPDGTMYSMFVDLIESDLNSLDLALGSGVPSESAANFRLLQHFHTNTSLTIGSDICKQVMHCFVTRLARQHEYLMHMVLAVSAAHLKRLYAEEWQLNQSLQYSLAEAMHWQTGLEVYRKQLEVSKPHFDAAIGTTFLTTIFTFALDDEIPIDAFSDANDEKFKHAINPLAATSGFRALQNLFGDFMNNSIWRAVLMGSDDDAGTFTNFREPGIEGLPIAFVDLCELDASSSPDNNEYHLLVRLLTPILKLEPNPENFTKLIAFGGRSWPTIKPLVNRRDPRGLLLLSYWFAALGQVDQWWLKQRAKTECAAIVAYLSQLQDPKINALLPYPESFGQADLSYIWDPPVADSDSHAIFERYFKTTIKPLQMKPSP